MVQKDRKRGARRERERKPQNHFLAGHPGIVQQQAVIVDERIDDLAWGGQEVVLDPAEPRDRLPGPDTEGQERKRGQPAHSSASSACCLSAVKAGSVTISRRGRERDR